MRSFVTPRWLVTLALAGATVLSASAEVIHLKNGDVIYADSVKKSGNRVEYAVGDDTYAIPASRVETIDAGAAPPRNGAQSTVEMPAYTPDTLLTGEAPLLEKIVRDGNVDRVALEAIASERDNTQTATAFYLAGKLDYEAGKFTESRRDFERSLSSEPENPTILNYYSALLVRMGDAKEAVPYAERAVRLAPDSPDALAVLGYAQYASDHPKDAVQTWKRSLALRPDASIQKILARAEREVSTEGSYSERETGHFLLRYEGRQSSDAFRSQLLDTLESDYADLSREFGHEPRTTIAVVLYTDQAFFDVTQSPTWMSAINDGKLRIPLQGLSSVTPNLARVLRHELTHSFVNQLTLDRCPYWLNEGVAQMMEPKRLVNGPALAQLFHLQQEFPLNSLEASFSSFNAAQASVAYDEALAATQYIHDRYGMSDVLRILERLGQGESIETALRGTIHCDYRQLQDEIRADLARQYGR